MRTLLFDGEPGLATAAAQQLVLKKYHIKLYADPKAKRNLAERAIRGKMDVPPPPLLRWTSIIHPSLFFSEFKLRLSIILEQQSKPKYPKPPPFIMKRAGLNNTNSFLQYKL